MGNFLVHNVEFNNKESFDDIINLANNYKEYNLKQDKNLIFKVSNLENELLSGKRIFENENWQIGFAGDLLDFKQIPYQLIINILEEEHFYKLKSLNGIFSIIGFNKKNKKYYLISDRRSQHPAYYYIHNKIFIFSTELSIFCKLLSNPKFNDKWLFDFLYFNFTIDNITYLENVYSMPAASVLIYDQNKNKFNIREYSSIFKKKRDY